MSQVRVLFSSLILIISLLIMTIAYLFPLTYILLFGWFTRKNIKNYIIEPPDFWDEQLKEVTEQDFNDFMVGKEIGLGNKGAIKYALIKQVREFIVQMSLGNQKIKSTDTYRYVVENSEICVRFSWNYLGDDYNAEKGYCISKVKIKPFKQTIYDCDFLNELLSNEDRNIIKEYFDG